MRPRGLNRPLRRCELFVMRKLLGTIAAMLATLVLAVLASGAGWDTHGDFSAQSLSESDHASASELCLFLVNQEERSRGRCSLD